MDDHAALCSTFVHILHEDERIEREAKKGTREVCRYFSYFILF